MLGHVVLFLEVLDALSEHLFDGDFVSVQPSVDEFQGDALFVHDTHVVVCWVGTPAHFEAKVTEVPIESCEFPWYTMLP